jgi:CheY-like chemotaxis protein
MGELVRDQLQLGSTDYQRISCTGPVVMLEPQAALHLALILHELGTNARKYGSLSVPQGRVSISWTIKTNGARNIALEWKESGGPRVHAPSEHGFGTALIEQSLQADGGTANIDYDADGLACRIRFPLNEVLHADTYSFSPIGSTGEEVSALSRETNQPGLAGKRILVIEDETLISMDLEASLTKSGCEVLGPASTLDQARHLIEKGDFDAALVDANLSGRPVDELAAALAKRNIPFAFVTGYGREALPAAFGEGIVLDKPFTQEQLLATVGLLFNRDAPAVRLRSPRS